MSEILGILDALEAMIAQGGHIPLTGKVVLEEYRLIQLVTKLRLVVQNGETMIRESIEVGQILTPESSRREPTFDALPMIQDAVTKAEKIKSGANEYAEYVLANLQLVVSKIQKDIAKMERSIEKGRSVLDQAPSTASQEEPPRET